MVRGHVCLGLLPPLLILVGCERSEVRKAKEALQLVRAMGADMRAGAAEAADRFTKRPDYEAMRHAFGDDGFDAGTPLGPTFQQTLGTLTQNLVSQLEREPKDAEFLRKAVRRMRQYHQWWVFVRREMETRRDKLAQATKDHPTQMLLGGRVRREDVLTVMAETIQVVGRFEASAYRCVQGIENLLARP
jgi:hypothetical protein